MAPGPMTALLVVYWSGDPLLQESMVTKHAADLLMGEGLVEYAEAMPWRVTEKGSVFVRALCAVPLPVQQWGVPHAA